MNESRYLDPSDHCIKDIDLNNYAGRITIPARRFPFSSDKKNEMQLVHIPISKLFGIAPDITISISTLPDEFDAVYVCFGAGGWAKFDRASFGEVEKMPVLLSRIDYVPVNIMLRCNAEYLMQHEQYVMEDEFRTVEELGDDEVEIDNGGSRHIGKIVTRVRVPTGRQVRKVTCPVDVEVPEIVLHLCYKHLKVPYKTLRERYDVPFLESIDLETCGEELVQKLKSWGELVMVDGKAYRKNFVKYNHGWASVARYG
jgi:hypothetical protein